MVNRVSTLFDGDAKGLRSSLKSVVNDIKSAEGLTGKFKAGISGMGNALKQNAGPAALAAGAALVAFGIKAVAAFEQTAKAAIDMGAAVGLGVEDASRWIAVGEDMAITADQLTSAFGKVGKSLDSGKWEEYGVATRDAAGSTRSTNDIILDTFDSLSKITNQTDRAKAGNDLFGKGYANLAPLIGKTRAEMEAYLGSVEDGQVITSEEAKKAERMRLAQDKLSDALNEGTMAAGEFVANLAPLISGLADVVTWLSSVQEATEGWARDLAGLGDDVAMGLGKIDGGLSKVEVGTADWSRVLDDFNTGTGADFKNMVDDQADALADADRNLQTLKGHLDEKQSWNNAQDAIEDLMLTMADGESSWRDLSDATMKAVEAVADYITTAANIPPEVKSSLYVALDQGNLDGVRSFIDSVKRGFDMPIYPKIQPGGIGRYATGGRPEPGVPAIVNDGGRQEVFVPDTPGRVYASVGAAQRAGKMDGGGINVVVNVAGDGDAAKIRQVVATELARVITDIKAGRR